MDNKINLSQLADLLSQAGGMSKSASEQFVKNFFDVISQSVLAEGLVKVKGLGTFKLIEMEDRESVNVNTGERFTIVGHQKISFIPDTELKELINKPFSSFDTIELSAEQAEQLTSMDKDEKPDSSQSDDDVKEKAEPVAKKGKKVREESDENKGKKKGLRIFLKSIMWILIVILVIFVLGFVFWPIIGTELLELNDRHLNGKDKTEIVTDTATHVISTPAKQKDDTEVKTESKPSQPSVKPQITPQPESVPVSKPAIQPVVNSENGIKTQKIILNSQDENKDLSEFTVSDVNNFDFDGLLDTYTLRKGETLTVVALKYYGSKKLWPYLVKYNNISDPSRLGVGTIVRIPVLKSK